MAESKTKEASNFWRNHVLELQARLRTLHGDSASVGNGSDEDIMAATRLLLEEHSDPVQVPREPGDYVPPSAADVSQSFSNMSSCRTSGTDTTGSSEWAEGGILAKGNVLNQLAYLRGLYELIDLLIMLLDIDKLLEFVDAQKIPEKLKDAFKKLEPENIEKSFKENGYEKYFDPDYLHEEFEKFEDQIDIDQFFDDLERDMTPESYKKFMKNATKDMLGPEELRETMNLDRIREMTDPVALRYYFQQKGLDKVWDLDKLKEIMDANKLREALDANNIREVLKTRTMRDFMGDNYRGPKPMVEVVAPSNLPGGYRFEAEIDGHRFVATVVSAILRECRYAILYLVCISRFGLACFFFSLA